MRNLEEVTSQLIGKPVIISTTEGRYNGTLIDQLKGEDGSISTIVLRQYFHQTKVDVKDILFIRQE